ncbi:hypothetical protein BC827DRAFT_1269631 [Russula dissimulans]|nr:hypothetical protein BC827DRAFT_1269631 [Russula dissimulans]
MAGVEQHHGNHFPGNAFPAAVGASEPRNVPAFPVPPGHHPRSPPSPHRRPAPQRGHASEPHDALFLPVDAAHNRRPDGNWGDMTPPVDEIAAPNQPQYQRYLDMAYDHNPARHYYPPQPGHLAAPYEYHGRDINSHARASQYVAAQPPAIAPPGPGIEIFDYLAQQPPAGPAPAFFNEWPHQPPFPNEAATELLRRLASRYLNQQDAHVYMLRIEPCPAGGFRVDITFELVYLF